MAAGPAGQQDPDAASVVLGVSRSASSLTVAGDAVRRGVTISSASPSISRAVSSQEPVKGTIRDDQRHQHECGDPNKSESHDDQKQPHVTSSLQVIVRSVEVKRVKRPRGVRALSRVPRPVFARRSGLIPGLWARLEGRRPNTEISVNDPNSAVEVTATFAPDTEYRRARGSGVSVAGLGLL
jgi:hypothetical protein